jgi:hypothetical protein
VTDLPEMDDADQDEEDANNSREERILPINASGTARTEGYDIYRKRDRRAIIVQQDKVRKPSTRTPRSRFTRVDFDHDSNPRANRSSRTRRIGSTTSLLCWKKPGVALER